MDESRSMSHALRAVRRQRIAALVVDSDLYPFSPLQHVGFFVLFFFPSLALLVVLFRVYTRTRYKQFGWGK